MEDETTLRTNQWLQNILDLQSRSDNAFEFLEHVKVDLFPNEAYIVTPKGKIITEIVAYATARGITVIPEIEMPAHAMSAIAAYPELSCHKRPIGVPSGAVWPITDIYCAGQEETFDFIEEVLTEMLALFPSQYIHVGGDEATHTEWERCPKCQLRMKEHQLKNEHQLQSYFIKRIDDFLTSKGRTLIS